MSFDSFSLPAVFLIGLAALILLIGYDWRLNISALGVVYVGSFVLVGLTWPLELAVVKLVAGWIAASVLGIGLANLPTAWRRPGRYWPSEVFFRISAAGLVGVVAVSLVPNVRNWVPQATSEQILGALILLVMGILHLGLTAHPLHTIIGLLIFLAGFEIFYAVIESSVLVAGFLAVINLGIALVGAYLLAVPTLETDE